MHLGKLLFSYFYRAIESTKASIVNVICVETSFLTPLSDALLVYDPDHTYENIYYSFLQPIERRWFPLVSTILYKINSWYMMNSRTLCGKVKLSSNYALTYYHS